MVNKKKEEEITTEELIKELNVEPTLDGFRKGITKKDILKSMTKEEWVRLDKERAAEELLCKNEIAYKAFILNDQLRKDFESLKVSIEQNVNSAKELNLFITKNSVDIASGRTEQKDSTGALLTIDDLKLSNMKMDVDIKRIINLLATNFNKLYNFVGHMGLDRKVFFTEEQYNDIAKDTIREFKGIGYEIFK